jgi:hypothetical protein
MTTTPPAAPAPAVPEGEIVITKDEDGVIVSVTRQNEEGRIISVLAESTIHAAPAVREPLTTKQLEVVIYDHTKLNPNQADDRELIDYIVNAIRAIEAHHGIGGGGK